jgi:phosphocarrier protein
VTVKNRNGIHARPASEFVKLAGKYQAEIMLGKDEMWVNGKSIMGVMTLAAEFGSTLTIRAKGDDAHEAATTLAECLSRTWTEE